MILEVTLLTLFLFFLFLAFAPYTRGEVVSALGFSSTSPTLMFINVFAFGTIS